jgi:hypothetical protein
MVRINNVKHMPLHPAAVDFRRYGGERAKPAGDATTEHKEGLVTRTMQGAVTPKRGRCCKSFKSFARVWWTAGIHNRVAACSGQSSHGARRRARRMAQARARLFERIPAGSVVVLPPTWTIVHV